MGVQVLYRSAGIGTLVLGGCFLLAGCSSVESVRGPDGTPHRLVHCRMGLKHCHEKAAEVCGKYRVVNSSGQVKGYTDETSEGETALLIKCEK